jgi:soluble lytic murein transglycosylase
MALSPDGIMSNRPPARARFGAAACLVLGAIIVGFGPTSPALRADTTIKDSPAPEPPAAEKEYLDKLNAALAPLLSSTPGEEEVQHLRDAVEAVRSNSLGRFAAARDAVRDPVGRKLADWVRLRSGFGEVAEYQAFLRENPHWPDRTLLTQRLEEVLFTHGGSAKAIKDYFASFPPETGVGYAALASADLADGSTEEARKLAAKVWREMTIPATLENGFLSRFGQLLTPSDHKWRFDRMVTDDVRFAGNRADRVAVARRIIPLLPAAEQKVATARLAVFNKAANARVLMNALPSGDESDTGLAFHREQILRKAGKIEEAARIILAIPPDPNKVAVLDEWWAERRELAYGALKIGKTKLAYELVKDAGPLTVNPLKEQTFMAGWIALRYLKNTDAAEKHFKDLEAAADGPLSRAKAAYWLGRVADVRGDRAAAAKQYRIASRNPDTFHGLLAMQMLDPGRKSLEIAPPALPSAEQIEKLVSLDTAKAFVLAAKAKLPREYTRSLLAALRNGSPSEAEAGMVAYLANALGDPQMSVRIAKTAVAKGQNLLTYAYPLRPFPAYKPLRTPPEAAFLLGIARQETEFESQTVSGAGAKGLLQVMTVTANHVCHDYKIKCQIPRLLSDNQYNVMIASAYIADRMDEFGGSYVLGLAGYNAGPGRARQWIRENGDPRDPNIDPIDWIERIPITETREYVTKVLANIQVYRARLGDTAHALRVQQDLVRARGNFKVPGGNDPGAAASDDTEG